MTQIVTAVAVLLLLAVAGTAQAGLYSYHWSYSSSLYTGSGTLTIDPSTPQNGGGGVDAYVPVFNGTFNGQTITGLDTSGAYNNWFYFQDAHGSYVLTSPTQPLWQVYEFAFTTSTDEYVMNSNGVGTNPAVADHFETFETNNGGSGVFGSDDAYDAQGNFNPTAVFSITPVTAVPEPSSAAVFGFAVVFIGLVNWRRRATTGA